jgi:hypothetical protein
MMTLEQLELLLWTLERAQSTNDGVGIWLPEQYSKDLRTSITLIKKEIAEAKQRRKSFTG